MSEARLDLKERAETFIAALGATGIAAAAAKYCTPSYRWWTPGLGYCEDQMEDFLRRMSAHVADGRTEIEVIRSIQEGPRVALEAQSRWNLTNGSQYNNHYHFLIEFEGEKIALVKEYNDTAHARETWSKLLNLG